jgi:hypothetical protein
MQGEIDGHVVRREERNAYEILVGKLHGKRPVGTPNHRFEDNINMRVDRPLYEGINWIHLAQDTDL